MNTSVQPDISSIDIVYQDDYLIAINKPYNYLVHQSNYAGNLEERSIVEFLFDQENAMFYPIHRLDRKTSGILLLARQKEYVKDFQALFADNRIEKTYYAVVRGAVAPSGIVDTPVKNADTGVYRDALTAYETLYQIELDIPVTPYPKSRYSLVKLMPKTGRMHQLRKHMNKISHPIVGDYKYGDRFHNRMFETEFNWHNLFLHALSVTFTHPFTHASLTLKAEFPDNWLQLLEQFHWKHPDHAS